MSPVQKIPAGYRTVTPHLTVAGAARAIDFYTEAFGAKELSRSPMPGTELLMHAALQIGDSIVMLNDEMPGPEGCPRSPGTLGGTPVTLHLYFEDVDAAFERAVKAGGEVLFPVQDCFWGDRYGIVKDPFGHSWSMATHIADPTPEEMARGAEEMMKMA